MAGDTSLISMQAAILGDSLSHGKFGWIGSLVRGRRTAKSAKNQRASRGHFAVQ
jgi:hypothetical protein